MLKVAVLVSGGGTNLQAILDAIDNGVITNTTIGAVISNNPSAYALQRAKAKNIPACCLSPRDFDSRDAYYDSLLEMLKASGADLIVLAGFMVVIPDKIIKAYPNQIINVHPSLIPAFCGTGYYGLKVHEAALKRGVKYSGATVHFVDEGTDTGPIIMQKPVAVDEGATPESLQKKIMQEAEWIILPEVINLIAQGRVEVIGGSVKIS